MTNSFTRFLAVATFLVSGWAASALAADFSLKETPGKQIDVSYQGRVVLRLMTASDTSTKQAAHDTYKVFAHVMDPLDEKNERTLTKGPGDKYTHHRGIYIGWSKANVEGVGGVDTWHMSNGVRQHFDKIVEQKVGDDSATLSVAIDWVKGDQPLLDEQRTFVVHKPQQDGAVLIDVASKITATVGKTQLKGDPEHAGLQYRAHEAVAANNSAKYIFPNDGKPGAKGDKDMPWAAMTYQIGDQDYYVQHMSHPTLPKGNIYSAYRPYGRFGAYFVQDLEKGETATFKVRLFVSPGNFPSDASTAMKERYSSYVSEVK